MRTYRVVEDPCSSAFIESEHPLRALKRPYSCTALHAQKKGGGGGRKTTDRHRPRHDTGTGTETETDTDI